MYFERIKPLTTLLKRLDEKPAYLIFITGPSNIGKKTMVYQAIVRKTNNKHSNFMIVSPSTLPDSNYIITIHSLFQDARQTDEGQSSNPHDRSARWLLNQWQIARTAARALPPGECYILVIEEIQKIPQWTEVVKGLWDADRLEGLEMHVIFLVTPGWLMQNSLTESLAGRFESIHMTHWSFPEMQQAFGFSLEEYIYFGGYPDGVHLIRNNQQWHNYVRNRLVYPNIEKDILQMARVDKPTLLKALFKMACLNSGQITSYTKLVAQLQNAGNTVTLTHYLNLFSQAGLVTALTKYSKQAYRQRASIPKLNVLNTALISALSTYTFDEARADRSYWEQLVKSTIGAHLINTASETTKVQYWNKGADEVDFILTNSRTCVAISVKSGAAYSTSKGLNNFGRQYKKARLLVIGKDGIPLPVFLSKTAEEWLN